MTMGNPRTRQPRHCALALQPFFPCSSSSHAAALLANPIAISASAASILPVRMCPPVAATRPGRGPVP